MNFKTILTFILIFMGSAIYAQQAKPVKPTPGQVATSEKSKESGPVYMVPTGSVNDTLLVYAVVASINQPLSLQGYQLITKSFIYEDGTKKPSEQYLEKVVDGIVTPVKNWRERTLYIVERKKLEE